MKHKKFHIMKYNKLHTRSREEASYIIGFQVISEI